MAKTIPPQVSIVFPTFERRDDVINTLRKIRTNVPPPHEVLILDNSANPHSLELSKNERYEFLGYNAGTAARNVGIQLAKAPFILMLDDDSHPHPDSVGKAIDFLQRSPKEVAGAMANVTRSDGSHESSLLPSVLLGCGVLFKTDVLRKITVPYPGDFRFYGEEYWLTLCLHHAGFRLEYCQDLRVRHRLSSTGRNLREIFYRLGRNNGVIWRQFCPRSMLDQVLHDTFRRYELTSAKEGVADDFRRGRQDALPLSGEPTPLSEESFRSFALLDRFEETIVKHPKIRRAILCGTGKFPTVWSDLLESIPVIEEVALADLNPAIAGHDFQNRCVISIDEAVSTIQGGHTPIVGHTSDADTLAWLDALLSRNIPRETIVSIRPLPA